MPVLPLLLYFFVCWLLLTVGAYFRPWLLLPVMTVMVLLFLLRGVIFLGAGFIVLKFLLLCSVEGIPAPACWLGCFLLQLAAWPLMRMISLIFMQYYGGRVRR